MKRCAVGIIVNRGQLAVGRGLQLAPRWDEPGGSEAVPSARTSFLWVTAEWLVARFAFYFGLLSPACDLGIGLLSIRCLVVTVAILCLL